MNKQTERMEPARPIGTIVTDTMSGSLQGAWQAVQTPLEDVGLKRQPIPPLLQSIARNPYAPPANPSCAALQKEISELDKLLGPDVCTLVNPTGVVGQPISSCSLDDPSGEENRKGEYVEKGAGYARDQAVGMVRSQVNIIPFRSVVRSISGATRHAKEVERAYNAGKLRRAFLKGLLVTNTQCFLPSR